MNIKNLDISQQNEVVYIVTKETIKSPETLSVIVKSREHFINWLINVAKVKEDDDTYLHLCQYNKHTFANGDTYRIYPYQLNSFDNYE